MRNWGIKRDRKTAVFLLVLMTGILLNSNIEASQNYNPVADPAAVVINKDVRITVLTPRVLRMEWSADAKFEDNASLTFVNRKTQVPEFTTKEKDGYLEVLTDCLKMRYKIDSGQFTADNLSVEFDTGSMKAMWHFGDVDDKNLLGTTRTLDHCNGGWDGSKKKDIELETGLISRNGWCAIDDSKKPLFDNSDWPWVMPRPEGQKQDIYFFAYGNDYKAALKDFTLIAGKIALPPKFAFGAWWSRYWNYDDLQLRDIVEQFDRYDLGLDVLVIDMDWHITSKPQWFDENGKKIKDQAGQRPGWTGFTWNENYFPDPAKFLDWTNKNDIKTCLNLHPASGIQSHEKQYEQMAESMGVDPATKNFVPFDIVNKDFAKAYVELLLRPMEQEGIDFWWLDWQQWSTTTIEGVNPTFYLNYVHYSDMEREGKRPLIFHRWGGLGNHRYQIGFSGDTITTWTSLKYQPYFTATAANVGFGYWSHDIGGHYCRYGLGIPYDPQLYTRWIQWGVLSPIFRTHCTSDRSLERRPWAYPVDYFQAMRKAYDLRYALLPYVYTSARQAYDTGISLCRPLYYDWPEQQQAYDFHNEYMFGDNLLVHPITDPMVEGKVYSMQKTWLPEGTWIEYYTGKVFDGPQVVERAFTIDEIPIYVKAGAIIPTSPKINNTADDAADSFIVDIYPGGSGKFRLYEDAGNDQGFESDKFAFTNIEFTSDDKVTNVVVKPVSGDYDQMPQARSYKVRLVNTFAPKSVEINGRVVGYEPGGSGDSWYYDGDQVATVVCVSSRNIHEMLEITVNNGNGDTLLLSGMKGRIKRLHSFVDYVGRAPEPMYEFEPVISTSLSGLKMTYEPNSSLTTAENFDSNYAKSLGIIESKCDTNEDWNAYLELLQLD